MKLEFIYSPESELQRVKETLNKRDWFKNFNYRLFFPEGFDLDSKNTSGLKKQIEKELITDKINQIEEDINRKWQTNIKKIQLLLDSTPYEIPETFKIKFTQYGVGGSYWLPNLIIINVSYTWLDCFETLLHELVHLLIEKPVIEKYKLNHGQKEALIDYIMTHNKYLKEMFPKYETQEAFVKDLPDKKVLQTLDWI